MNQIDKIGQIDEISQIDQIGKIRQISQIGNIDQLDQIGQIGQIDRIGQLDQIYQIDEFDQRDQIRRNRQIVNKRQMKKITIPKNPNSDNFRMHVTITRRKTIFNIFNKQAPSQSNTALGPPAGRSRIGPVSIRNLIKNVLIWGPRPAGAGSGQFLLEI